jgi:hypothetical protein
LTSSSKYKKLQDVLTKGFVWSYLLDFDATKARGRRVPKLEVSALKISLKKRLMVMKKFWKKMIQKLWNT